MCVYIIFLSQSHFRDSRHIKEDFFHLCQWKRRCILIKWTLFEHISPKCSTYNTIHNVNSFNNAKVHVLYIISNEKFSLRRLIVREFGGQKYWMETLTLSLTQEDGKRIFEIFQGNCSEWIVTTYFHTENPNKDRQIHVHSWKACNLFPNKRHKHEYGMRNVTTSCRQKNFPETEWFPCAHRTYVLLWLVSHEKKNPHSSPASIKTATIKVQFSHGGQASVCNILICVFCD